MKSNSYNKNAKSNTNDAKILHEVRLRNDKPGFSKWFVFFILGIIVCIVSYSTVEDEQMALVMIIISLLSAFIGIYLSLGKKILKVSEKELIIHQYYPFYDKMKKYEIGEIYYLEYRINVKSNLYTSSSKVKVMGIDVTPESAKNYYYHKEIISFTYKNKAVEIGKWKKIFGADKIVSIINELKAGN